MGSVKKTGVANLNFSLSPMGSLIYFLTKAHGVGNFDRVLYSEVESTYWKLGLGKYFVAVKTQT